jgi:enterochelin esterase-like enzyme
MKHRSPRSLLFAASVLLTSALISSGVFALDGRIVRVEIYGKSLEGNVISEPADRYISIYLPPGYDASRDKRYPVLYLLHGISDTDLDWTSDPHNSKFDTIQGSMDEGIASGCIKEMLVIMPNERTAFLGSFYTNSKVTGASIRLSDRLRSLGIKHDLEIYNGDHGNRLWGVNGRLRTVVLPYFSSKLEH